MTLSSCRASGRSRAKPAPFLRALRCSRPPEFPTPRSGPPCASAALRSNGAAQLEARLARIYERLAQSGVASRSGALPPRACIDVQLYLYAATGDESAFVLGHFQNALCLYA